MNNPEADDKPKPADPLPTAGLQPFMLGVYGIVIFVVIWQALDWLLPFLLPHDWIRSVIGVLDAVGLVAVLCGGSAGFAYVTWKYVESAWLRWTVLVIEALIVLFMAYGFWLGSQTTPS